MRFDNSWAALVRPGESESYFDFPTVRRPQPFREGFCPVNALWMAELSRLVYLQETAEAGGEGEAGARGRILQRQDLRETHFFDRGGTQCAVVVTAAGAPEPFGAVVFRGTHGLRDWMANLNVTPASWRSGGIVHRGFSDSLLYVWDDLEEALRALDLPLFYTGHSLGAALATLAASLRPPQVLYTFGSPRVGDLEFATALEGVPTFRVVNNRDIVTGVPHKLGRVRLTHVGEVRRIAPDSSLRIDASARRAEASRRPSDRRRWFDPPRLLADHAPVNYAAHLSRLAAAGDLVA